VHGACPALGQTAPKFCPRELQIFAQDPQQRLIRLDMYIAHRTVNIQAR
jgi:hypothetical protein